MIIDLYTWRAAALIQRTALTTPRLAAKPVATLDAAIWIMLEVAMKGRSLTIALLLLVFQLHAARGEAPVPANQLSQLLSTIAQGRDPAFGPAVAPALGVDKLSPAASRATTIVTRIAQEIELVASAFATAAPANKIAATRAAVARVSSETARDGASRSFEGDGPSLSVMRQVLFVPTASAGADPASRVMEIISRFERSPKPDDTYYEYTDAMNLKSPVAELPGSAESWTTKARPAMEPGKVYALKKCRNVPVLGWYCNTQLYQIRDLPGSDAGVKLLVTFLRPLPKGADNPAFGGGKAENIVDGYTATYVTVASGDLLLVYSLGIQSRPDRASQQSRLNAGHKEEYRQLVRRLEAALQIPKLPF